MPKSYSNEENPCITYLAKALEHAKMLRRENDEERAFLELKFLSSYIHSNSLFETLTKRDSDLGTTTLLLKIELEYAATCTQHAFSLYEENWHGAAISIEKKALDYLTTLPEAPAANVEKLKLLQGLCNTALGLSFQRPFKRFRNTPAAVKYAKKAFEYFFVKGTDALRNYLSSTISADSDQNHTDILNAVKYSGNYAAALHQLGLDCMEGRHYQQALKNLEESLLIRRKIEKELIRPYNEMSDRLADRLIKSCVLTAGSMQAIARINSDEKTYSDAIKLYDSAINQLQMKLDARYATPASLYDLKVTLYSALYGAGWCHYHIGRTEEALELHREAYNGRLELLGPSHIDTVKSSQAISRMERSMLEKDYRHHRGLTSLRFRHLFGPATTKVDFSKIDSR